MREVSPPTLDSYRFAYLTEDEEPEVQALLERCADYLELVAELPARKKSSVCACLSIMSRRR